MPDYTIIAGHQRFKIAQELGLEKVPVVIINVSPEEAEYLLIADNEERRQEDNDPITRMLASILISVNLNLKVLPLMIIEKRIMRLKS